MPQTLVPRQVPGFPPLTEGLWPNRQVSVLAGTSGAGKTTFLYQLMAAWCKGELGFGFSGPPGPYGLVAADRTIEAHKVTAATVGLAWDSLVVRSLVDDAQISIAELEHQPFPLLFKLLDSVRNKLPPDHARIIVDPLMVFLGVDLNKYHLVAARLLAINRWCLANNAQVIATHHATKARSDWSFKRPQDRIAGSGALLAFTSTQGFLAAPDEIGSLAENPDQHAELILVSHHHAPLVLRLTRNDIGLFVVVAPKKIAAAGPQQAQPKPALSLPVADDQPGKQALAVLDILAEGQATSRRQLVAQLADQASAPTVDRALAELIERQLVDHQHGWYRKKTRQ